MNVWKKKLKDFCEGKQVERLDIQEDNMDIFFTDGSMFNVFGVECECNSCNPEIEFQMWATGEYEEYIKKIKKRKGDRG